MSLQIRQKIWVTAGAVSLVLSLVGVFLPVAPTTPFVLLAAFCFAKGSPKALAWLENNKFFGQILKDYRAGLGVPLSTKITSLVTLWTGLIISMLIVQKLWLSVVLICCGIGVTIHICHLKTRKSDAAGQTNPESSSQHLQTIQRHQSKQEQINS